MAATSGNADGKVRVAYFDDQLLFREALVSVLEESGSIIVVHSSGHGGLGLRALLEKQVGAMLIAFEGQTNDPMSTVREAQHIVPESPMCALVAVDRLDRAREAIALGCKGAVSTAASLSMLIAALQNLTKGQAFVDPTLAGRLLAKMVARNATSSNNRNGSRSAFDRDIPKN